MVNSRCCLCFYLTVVVEDVLYRTENANEFVVQDSQPIFLFLKIKKSSCHSSFGPNAYVLCEAGQTTTL